MGLKRTSDAATEVLTTAEAKLHLRVDHSDEDTYIDALVKAARRKAENYCRRAFITQTWQYTLDRFPAWELPLPRPPTISVSSVIYLDQDGASQTLSSALYRLAANGTPARISPAYNEVWPVTQAVTDAVTITTTNGYGAASSSVPEEIRHAVRLIVGHLYTVRDEDALIPKQALWLLDSYRCKDWTFGERK